MTEAAQPQASPAPSLEYGGHLGVYGRTEIYQHEQGLLNVWQGVTDVEKQQENFAEDMAFIRQDMQAFAGHPEVDQALNNYFESVQDMPQIFRYGKAQAEASSGTPLTWSGWLAEAATDDQVLNFLQWHNYRHENRPNDPGFQAEITQRKAEFLQNVQALHAQGGLHEDVLAVGPKLDEVQIIASDIFNAYIFGRVGFSHEEGMLVEAVEGAAPSILAHELKHKVIERPNDSEYDLWAREAVAEHTAQVMTNGANLNQFLPAEENPIYGLERTLMGKVMEGLDAKLVLRYYSALTEESMVQTKAELRQAFMAKYGVADVLEQVGRYINEHSQADEHTVNRHGVYLDKDSDKHLAVVAELIEDLRKALVGVPEQIPIDSQESRDRAYLTSRISAMRQDGWSDANIAKALHQRAANGHVAGIRQEPLIETVLQETAAPSSTSHAR